MDSENTAPPLNHLAIIMDGNGRWAKERGLSRSEGHKAGTESAREIVKACRKLGIKYLTLYAFSKENWNRPKEEINILFDLLVRFLKQEQKTLIEQSIRLNIIGAWEELPYLVRQALNHALSISKSGQKMVLNLALNYSGREDILRACRQILSQGLDPEKLNESTFRNYLYTQGQPDPDLIIRTSGEHRLSNYLIFQAAYSEFYFCSTYWPDFNEAKLQEALMDYSRRQRRFGGIEVS